MRIVHLTNTVVVKEPKKTAKQILHEICVLEVANQRIKDAKEAREWRYMLERKIG